MSGLHERTCPHDSSLNAEDPAAGAYTYIYIYLFINLVSILQNSYRHSPHDPFGHVLDLLPQNKYYSSMWNASGIDQEQEHRQQQEQHRQGQQTKVTQAT